jgi:hypothetical protein
MAHGLVFFVGVAIISVRAVVQAAFDRKRGARSPLRPILYLFVALSLPVAIALPSAVTLIRRPTVEEGTSAHGKIAEFTPLRLRLTELPGDTLERGSPDHIRVMKSAAAWFLACVLLSLFPSRRRRPDPDDAFAIETYAACLTALYLFGPTGLNWPSSIWLLAPRFAVPAGVALFLLPRAKLSGFVGIAMTAIALSIVGWNARLNRGHIEHFSAWAAPYDRVRAVIPKGARVLALSLPLGGDAPLEHHAIGSLYTYHMVDGAAYVAFLFDKPELPVHLRHDVVPRAPFWKRPWEYDPTTHGKDYDYLVLRGARLVRRTSEAGLHELVTTIGPWSVFKTKPSG